MLWLHLSFAVGKCSTALTHSVGVLQRNTHLNQVIPSPAYSGAEKQKNYQLPSTASHKLKHLRWGSIDELLISPRISVANDPDSEPTEGGGMDQPHHPVPCTGIQVIQDKTLDNVPVAKIDEVLCVEGVDDERGQSQRAQLADVRRIMTAYAAGYHHHHLADKEVRHSHLCSLCWRGMMACETEARSPLAAGRRGHIKLRSHTGAHDWRLCVGQCSGAA